MEFGYRPEAAEDIRSARRWYESQRPGLADQFLEAFNDTAELVTQMPEAFPQVQADVRRALLRRFPYALYYRIIGPTRLELIACLHTRRNPRILRTRR